MWSVIPGLVLRKRHGKEIPDPSGSTAPGSPDDLEAGQNAGCSHGIGHGGVLRTEKPHMSLVTLLQDKAFLLSPRWTHCPPQHFCLTLESIWILFMKSFFLLKHLNIDLPSLLFRERAPLTSRTCRFLGFQAQKSVQEGPAF